jgi:hypothetical protein
MPSANLLLEKRVNPRMSLNIPIKYRIIEDQREITTVLERNHKDQNSRTKDVSLDGLYLIADNVPEVGSVLILDITLPNVSRIISSYAEVVWSNDTGGGLHFEVIKEEDFEILKSYLSQAHQSK